MCVIGDKVSCYIELVSSTVVYFSNNNYLRKYSFTICDEFLVDYFPLPHACLVLWK